MDLDGAPPIFSSARTAFKWRLPASLWDGSYRASGTERNRIGVVRLSIGTARIVGSRAECSMVFSGASNSGPFTRVRHGTPGAQFVVEASWQSVESTFSTEFWISQRYAAAPLTTPPPLRDYGCCGPYGVIDVACESVPEGGPCHQLLLVAAGFDSPVGVPWTTTSSRHQKVRGRDQDSNSVTLSPSHPMATC